MTLLNDLRVDIADEAPPPSGAILLPSDSLVDDLTVQGDLVVCGSQSWGRRIITAAGNVTINSSDNIVLINKTVGEATAVTIPAPVTSKSRLLIIKDMKGDAAINNISITVSAGTIDGQSTWVLNQNYQSFTLIDNGTEWNII